MSNNPSLELTKSKLKTSEPYAPEWARQPEIHETVPLSVYATIMLVVYMSFAALNMLHEQPVDAALAAAAGVICWSVIRFRRTLQLGVLFDIVMTVVLAQQILAEMIKIDKADLGFLWILALPVIAGVLGTLRQVIVWSVVSIASLFSFSLVAPADHPFWHTPNTVAALGGVGLMFCALGYGVYWMRITRKQAVERSLTEAQDLILKREQAEREALVAAEKARAAENARRRFLATMSHELRTPMAGVILAADGLIDERLTDEQRQLVGSIRTAADSLINVLNDVLDLAKIDAGAFEVRQRRCSLRALIDDVAVLLARSAQQSNAELVIDIPPDLADHWNIDPVRTRQILLNLLINAIRHANGANIVISASAATDADGLRLVVADDGTGISPDALDNIFQPFVQTGQLVEAEAIGFGLGLSIVRDLVDAIGGQIDARSTIGTGSTFTVTLPNVAAKSPTIGETIANIDLNSRTFRLTGAGPAAQRSVARWIEYWNGSVIADGDESVGVERLDLSTPIEGMLAYQRVEALAALADQQPIDKPTLTGPGPNTRVPAAPNTSCLVVDDDEIVRIAIGSILTKAGYQVVNAVDGSEALQVLQSTPVSFVMLDLSMPGMNGLDCLRHIRRLRPPHNTVPVCIVSGTAMARGELLELGADEFVQKPSRAAELLDVARRMTVLSHTRRLA